MKYNFFWSARSRWPLISIYVRSLRVSRYYLKLKNFKSFMTRLSFTTFQYPKEKKETKVRPVLPRLKTIICLRISYFVSASLERLYCKIYHMEITFSPFTFPWICWRGDCRAWQIFIKYRFSFPAIAVLKKGFSLSLCSRDLFFF